MFTLVMTPPHSRRPAGGNASRGAAVSRSKTRLYDRHLAFSSDHLEGDSASCYTLHIMVSPYASIA